MELCASLTDHPLQKLYIHNWAAVRGMYSFLLPVNITQDVKEGLKKPRFS